MLLPVGLFDAAVDHLDEDVGIFVELDHELLVLLHLSEAVFVHYVGVVEEEVVLRGQLNLHILNVVVVVALPSVIIISGVCLQAQGS